MAGNHKAAQYVVLLPMITRQVKASQGMARGIIRKFCILSIAFPASLGAPPVSRTYSARSNRSTLQ